MAKFCTRCGNTLPEDGSACQSCAVTQPTAAQAAAPVNPALSAPVNPAPVAAINPASQSSIGQALNLEFTTEDDTAVVIGGNRIKIATIIKIAAIVIFVLFFLPLFSVSFQGIIKISFNGWNTVFGKTISSYGFSQKSDGNIVAILLALIPAALFAVFQFKKHLQFINGKLFLISTGLSALGFIGFIIFAIVVSSQAEGNMLKAQYTFWFFLTIILYIAAGLISLWCLLAAKKPAQQSGGALPPSGN